MTGFWDSIKVLRWGGENFRWWCEETIPKCVAFGTKVTDNGGGLRTAM